jgi:arginine/lysine/ornithine decarboxylase
MDTPICDFVKKYADNNTARFHMPGHKGKNFIGFEKYDITEIKGADSLYEADGIIAQSENNASSLFGCKTFYSTEGSSLCIRAMFYLAMLYANECKQDLCVFAGRNAHKTFLSASALLGFNVEWLKNKSNSSYLSFSIDIDELENALSNSKNKTNVVYITSPDYLGNISDVKQIANVCKKYNTLLFVDNAHGAYLKFLQTDMHPITLGADMCCDSAHKTLPVLTGGAYLHIAGNAPETFVKFAKHALALFGSTSPSYLILQSLDNANKLLCESYKDRLKNVCESVETLKTSLLKHGYVLYGNEPLKLTVFAKKYGYAGIALAEILSKNNIECEFADPDYTVFMFSADTEDSELLLFKNALLEIPKKQEIFLSPPPFSLPQSAMEIRKAVISSSERLPVEKCLGRISSLATVGCPPAVPIVVPGEIIDENTIECFKYYGIEDCIVVK